MSDQFNPAPVLELGGQYITDHYQMRSAKGYVNDAIWTKHIGKSGKIWLTLADGNADMMLVEGDPNSNGFGGATLECKLNDGSIQKLTGPWSSNTDALFRDTGIDLRQSIITWGCIGRWRDQSHENRYDHRYIIGALVHFDTEPTPGEYSRITNLARKMAFERDEMLFYYSQSFGGSTCGCMLPYEGSPDWDPKGRDNWSKAKELEKPYWEKYYVEFPHLDHRRHHFNYVTEHKPIQQED